MNILLVELRRYNHKIIRHNTYIIFKKLIKNFRKKGSRYRCPFKNIQSNRKPNNDIIRWRFKRYMQLPKRRALGIKYYAVCLHFPQFQQLVHTPNELRGWIPNTPFGYPNCFSFEGNCIMFVWEIVSSSRDEKWWRRVGCIGSKGRMASVRGHNPFFWLSVCFLEDRIESQV